jgi:uncharacterized protein YndB with AHSA1/START domain
MPRDIVIEQTYDSPIEAVWQAIATPDALASWLMPNDFKLEKGHRFEFRAPRQPGFDGIVRCQVLDFDAPRYLQYSWQGGPLKKPTLVTWKLTPVATGTHVHFTHTGFEASLGGYFVRFLLGNGWKGLLKKSIPNYLRQ